MAGGPWNNIEGGTGRGRDPDTGEGSLALCVVPSLPESRAPLRVSGRKGTRQGREVVRDLCAEILCSTVLEIPGFYFSSLGNLHVCYHFCFLETSYRKATPKWVK